jgi:large subunit ribosomal protein L10
MPITKQAKKDLVVDLIAKVDQAKEEILVGYQGLTVAELQELRAKLRAEKASFKVVKNTLLDKIFSQAKVEGIDPKQIKKPVALIIGSDEVMPAKVVMEFAKKHKKLEIFGGVLDKKAIDANTIKSLALLPNREQMLAQVVATFAAPVSGFVRVLGGVPRAMVYALSAIAKSKS